MQTLPKLLRLMGAIGGSSKPYKLTKKRLSKLFLTA